MTVLLIDPKARAEINAAVEEARKNVIPWEKMRHIAIDDRAKPTNTLMLSERKQRPDDIPQSIGIKFDGGVTAAISFEEQPAGIFRHLSVATGKAGKNHLPNPALMADLARLFGFKKFPPEIGRVWIEEYGPNQFAVNVIEMESERPIGGAA